MYDLIFETFLPIVWFPVQRAAILIPDKDYVPVAILDADAAEGDAARATIPVFKAAFVKSP